jgi:fatty acid desaturase
MQTASLKRKSTLTTQLIPLVRDLGHHRWGVYWTDFLTSILTFWISFCVLAYRAPVLDALSVIAFIVAVLTLYRSTCFMHEIAHLPRSSLPGFRWAWDLLCGIPMLLPSYFYASHIDHHAVRTYGTEQDPEYLPLLHTSKSKIALLVVGTLTTPLTLWFRFAVMAPLVWFIPVVRNLVDIRFSSVTLHASYRANAQHLTRFRSQVRFAELLATFWAWGATALVVTEAIPLVWPMLLLVVMLSALLINMMRTAFTHRYQHNGMRLTHAQQITDSVTWSDGWFVELFALLGLRYQTLHHVFPFLPYHALPVAHARLMAAGPAALDYQNTVRPQAPNFGSVSRT